MTHHFYISLASLSLISGGGMYMSLQSPPQDFGNAQPPALHVPAEDTVHELSSPDLISFMGTSISIQQGKIDHEGSWLLNDSAVFFLAPGSIDNPSPLLYAHATDTLFGPLQHMRPGDLIAIREKGTLYPYSLVGRQTVEPHDLSPIRNSSSDSIQLITCSGPFYSTRTIYTFKYQRDTL